MFAPPAWMVTIAKSRLVHFVAIGGTLFALAPHEMDGREVSISGARAEAAVQAEQARLGHSLRPAEKNEAISNLVDEEVLAREALRLGIGVEDPVIRARLAERMRAALASTLPPPDIREEELAREIARRAASAPSRVRLGVHFFRKDRPDAARAAEAFADGSLGGREDHAPIPDGAWWSEETLRRAAGAEVARLAMETEVGRRTVAASAWGLYVLVPLERRGAEPAELRMEAYEALRATKQAAALTRLVEQRRREYQVAIDPSNGDVPADRPPIIGRLD